jgi:hypothetical protein
MLHPNEVLFPEHMPPEDEFIQHPLEAPAENLMDVLKKACSADHKLFVFRPWQEDAIPVIVACLYTDVRPVLLNAAVGTGKTLIAGAAILQAVYGNTGYMTKAVIAVPLVELALEQHMLFQGWAKTLNRDLPTARRLKVAVRAGEHRRGDIRRAQIIIGTYEYARNFLADGDAPIYLRSQRLQRTWGQALSLVVVDEAHMIMSDRVIVVTSIIGLANYYAAPLLMMTGTSHDNMVTALQVYFDGTMLVYRNKPDESCQQIVMRVENEKAFFGAILGTFFMDILAGTYSHGILVFARAIRDVWQVFDEIVDQIRKYAAQPPPGLSPTELQRLAVIHRIMGSAEKEPDPSFDCTWSTVLHTHKNQAQSLANERILAKVALKLGIGYVWRDVGDSYYGQIRALLDRRRMRIIVATSKLAAGVNLPGVRHVGVHSQSGNLAELAQMIGRAGRHDFGFAWLLGIDPPLAEDVATSLPAPKLTALATLVDWWLLKKVVSPSLSEERNVGRWEWTYDQWMEFFVRLPLPCFRPEDVLDTISEAMAFMCVQAQLCSLTADDILVLHTTEGALRVAEGDAGSIGIAFHIGERVRSLSHKLNFPTIPWFQALVYWGVQIASLPRVNWAGRTHDLYQYLDPVVQNTKMSELVIALETAISSVVGTESRFGNPFGAEPDWTRGNLQALAVMTALILSGIRLPFSRFVARRKFALVIEELPPVFELTKEVARALKFTPEETHLYVTVPGETIEAAYAKLAALGGDRTVVRVAHDAPNPLFLVALAYNNQRPEPASLLAELVRAQLVERGLFETPQAAFPLNWVDSLKDVAPQPGAARDVQPAEPDSN